MLDFSTSGKLSNWFGYPSGNAFAGPRRFDSTEHRFTASAPGKTAL
jgi:hypothetical protein